jgi:DNA primase
VIAGHFGRVVIAFDGDAAGRSGARATAAALSWRGVGVRIAELPQGADVNSLLADGCDAGEVERLLAGDPR